jgi:hypothetical protein
VKTLEVKARPRQIIFAPIHFIGLVTASIMIRLCLSQIHYNPKMMNFYLVARLATVSTMN